MIRCTQLDEILHAHVSRQLLEPHWISRSWVKGQGHMDFGVFLCVILAATRGQYLALSTIRYDTLFALENWQASCQFNLAHKLKQELKQRAFARYRSMQCGVNRGDGVQLPNCRAEFLLKIHIAECGLSSFTWSVFTSPQLSHCRQLWDWNIFLWLTDWRLQFLNCMVSSNLPTYPHLVSADFIRLLPVAI